MSVKEEKDDNKIIIGLRKFDKDFIIKETDEYYLYAKDKEDVLILFKGNTKNNYTYLTFSGFVTENFGSATNLEMNSCYPVSFFASNIFLLSCYIQNRVSSELVQEYKLDLSDNSDPYVKINESIGINLSIDDEIEEEELDYGIKETVFFKFKNSKAIKHKQNAQLIGFFEDFLDASIVAADHISNIRKSGNYAFDECIFAYKPGEPVYIKEDETIIAGEFKSSKINHSPFGAYAVFTIKVITSLTNNAIANFANHNAYIFGWQGKKPERDLPLQKIKDLEAFKEKNKNRIEIFKRIHLGEPTYARCNGNIKQYSWYGETTKRANGRIMLDNVRFKGTQNDIYSDCIRYFAPKQMQSTFDSDANRKISKKNSVLNEDNGWMIYPYTGAFSFASKVWGVINIDEVSLIDFKDKAFDLLVLDDDKKKIIKALVKNASNQFKDIVEDKSGGVIFLLHGPPGQGKTLTAEAVAEKLKRPLYSVSIGELGVSPENLEDRLKQILDTAHSWNAVLLLDEADIFLEARNEEDVLRNAMVGVFLRLLEYHEGVMFLTTNRVKNIDPAFFSRISLSLLYNGENKDKSKKIWKNLSEAANFKISDSEILEIVNNYNLNGRQIKNVIRIAQAIAAEEEREPMVSDLLIGITNINEFKTTIS